jgi:hypothetical protein
VVARGARPSGRCSAVRRSVSAACVSLAQQIARAVERHRHAEQPLDHSLVDLACEVDPLLELVGLLELGREDARDRGQRRGLSERPQERPVGFLQRRARHQAVGEDHADRAAARRHRRAYQPGRLGDHRRVLVGHLAAEIADRLDDPVLPERPRRDRRRLDRHVLVGKARDVEHVGPRRAHAPAGRVVAEDHRAAHRRQPAHGLAQPVVEALAGDRAHLGL